MNRSDPDRGAPALTRPMSIDREKMAAPIGTAVSAIVPLGAVHRLLLTGGFGGFVVGGPADVSPAQWPAVGAVRTLKAHQLRTPAAGAEAPVRHIAEQGWRRTSW